MNTGNFIYTDVVNALFCSQGRLDLCDRLELEDGFILLLETLQLSSGALDCLRALVRKGPLEDGCVPTKAGRDELLRHGFAAKAVVHGQQGYQVATYKGWTAYRVYEVLCPNIVTVELNKE